MMWTVLAASDAAYSGPFIPYSMAAAEVGKKPARAKINSQQVPQKNFFPLFSSFSSCTNSDFVFYQCGDFIA